MSAALNFCKVNLILRKPICKNVFTASIHRKYSWRPKFDMAETARAVDSTDLTEIIQNSDIKTMEDWKPVRKKLLEIKNQYGNNRSESIDYMIIHCCNKIQRYDLGEYYIKYLYSEHCTPNIATLGKYLRLLFAKNMNSKKCDPIDEAEIYKIYDELKNTYSVLDAITLENIILALSLTSKWEVCLDLLKEIKITSSGSSSTYSALVATCLMNKKDQKAWELFKEMLELERPPTKMIYTAYIETVKKLRKKENVKNRLEILFSFLQEYEIKWDEEVVLFMMDYFTKAGFKSSLTQIPNNGVCKVCKHKLEKFHLTEIEFCQLRATFMKDVIVGKDLFRKTNPEELEYFTRFMDKMEKFDVVLDGLNIAYSAGLGKSADMYAKLLKSVVDHFVNQKKSVLVLGRAHMNRWPRMHWDYIKRNAKVFLTQNISQDDPYLLYCALNSGKDTIIVSRDLMRSHKFLLKYPKLKRLFNRWLSQNQYHLYRVDNIRGPIFQIPPQFGQLTQKNGGVWHIPYEKQTLKDGENKVELKWLCVDLNT